MVKSPVKKPLPDDECPWCHSTKILGPRVVRINEDAWCNCYACGHEWQVVGKEPS